jgi:arylsulfatase
VPYFVAPKILNRPHAITADADIPASGAEGVLQCRGSGVGGWTLYVQDGKLHYAHNYVSRAIYRRWRPRSGVNGSGRRVLGHVTRLL